MQDDLLAAHTVGGIVLATVAMAMVMRGARAHRWLAHGHSEVFPWNRVQRLGGTVLFGLAATAVLALPHSIEFARLKTEFDLAVALLITAALLCGFLDGVNRRVFMSESHVGAVTLTGSIKQLPWEAVTMVTYHDFYGGFFRLHSARCTIFIPAQIQRSQRAITLMEARVPSTALGAARQGIALIRNVLGR